jgi:hypothetical protein
MLAGCLPSQPARQEMLGLHLVHSEVKVTARMQVAACPRGRCMPATACRHGTTDIGPGGLHRVALHNKAAAHLGHSPSETQRPGPTAVVALPSLEYSAGQSATALKVAASAVDSDPATAGAWRAALEAAPCSRSGHEPQGLQGKRLL